MGKFIDLNASQGRLVRCRIGLCRHRALFSQRLLQLANGTLQLLNRLLEPRVDGARQRASEWSSGRIERSRIDVGGPRLDTATGRLTSAREFLNLYALV